MKTFCVVLMLLISGCTSVPKANPVIIEPLQSTVVIPPELLEDCVSFKPLTLETYNEAQTVEQIQIWSTDSYNCRLNHKALADIARRAFNIKTTNKTTNKNKQ